MATLALGRSCLTRYAKLDQATQKRVQAFADKCNRLSVAELAHTAGIHLETYENQRDPRARTVRLGDNHRGIVLLVTGSERLVLVDILLHDDADRWMMRNRFAVNAATGALEVIDVDSLDSIVAEKADSVTASGGLYDHRPDKAFTQLGIDAAMIPILRRILDEDELVSLVGFLPQGQAEALIALTGTDSVESIYTAIAGVDAPTNVDTADLDAALDAPASRSEFHVVTNDQDLNAVLAKPLSQWRVFLHPSQHDIAYRPSYNGPVRVTGGAGTGKTVVALHRANALAGRLNAESHGDAGRPILFTTFTRNLATAIQRDLLALGGAAVADRVEVANVDRIAHRIVTEAEGRAPGVVDSAVLRSLWEAAAATHAPEHTPAFLNQEWEQVVLAQGISSRDKYFAASRTGRGIRLDRRERAKVWKAIELVTHQLAERRQRTHLQIAASAAGYAAQMSDKPYRHVVVDEAQDLHEAQWRLLRAIAPETTDDLFIVGDAHQRIYDRRTSLSRVGINIRGRSRRLRINYRTTHEILGWSLALLGDVDYDDLDLGSDHHDLAGYHSHLHGTAPTVVGFESRHQMTDAAAQRVADWIDSGIAPEAIAVAGRTQASLTGVEQALRARGISGHRLGRELKSGTGVAFGTMHRLKGLEFRAVAVVDVDDRSVPSPKALTPIDDDPTQHEHDLRSERCLLYVACSRARDELWVGWAGTASRFLPPVGDAQIPAS